MFTWVKPGIICSIWPGAGVLMYSNCKTFISRLETPTAVIQAKAGCPWPSLLLTSCQCLTMSHLNWRLTGRVISPFLLYSHVLMTVATNPWPENKSRDQSRPIINQSAMTPPMSDPICPDTGAPWSLYPVWVTVQVYSALCLSPANPRVIYGLHDPPDASTGAGFRTVFLVMIALLWFILLVSKWWDGYRILWP